MVFQMILQKIENFIVSKFLLERFISTNRKAFLPLEASFIITSGSPILNSHLSVPQNE